MNTQSIQKENIIVGLDIGTTKICCIVSKKVEGQKIEIVGVGVVPSRGVQDGEVKNIRDTADDIKLACQKAKENSGYDFQEVFVGIAGAHIRSTQFRLGFTRPDSTRLIDHEDITSLREQVRNLTNEPGEVIISYQAQEYYVDQKIPIHNKPVGMMGNRLEADWHVITGNINSTKSIELSVTEAGYRVMALDLEPLASAAAVLTEEQMEEGVCLVDIGGGTTDIAIFHKGIIRHTAIFPYAGEYITSIIQNKLKLRYEAAKKLKETTHATSALYQHIPDNKLLSIPNLTGLPPVQVQQRYYCRLVNACLEQLFTQVKKEINASNIAHQLNAGIVVTGGGAMIPNLKNFVETFTGFHAQIGLPTSRLSNLQNKSLAQSMYSTSIGLALLASDHSDALIVDSGEYGAEEVLKLETPIAPEVAETKETSKPESNIFWLRKMQQSFKKFLIDEDIKEFEDR